MKKRVLHETVVDEKKMFAQGFPGKLRLANVSLYLDQSGLVLTGINFVRCSSRKGQ
jgi:hypothetical protein